jgi:putative ABC transport system substrate-binding protein
MQFDQLKRREFITLVGSAVAWPVTAGAQRFDGTRRIGVLMDGAADDQRLKALLAALRVGLRKLGWIEGQNLHIDDRWAEGDPSRIRTYAKELVAVRPDVLLTGNTVIVQELQQQTQTIPIVFVALGDPVATGVVASLARPGGNATGFMNPEPSVSGKWLELLKEIAPRINTVLVMVNAGNVANASRLHAIERTGLSSGIGVSSSAIRKAGDIESAIASILGQSNTGLIVTPGAPISDHRKMIFELANRNHLPAIYPYRDYVAEGGLMSYGAEPLDMWQSAASYVDRIFKGAKAADLPVQEPTTYKLVLNLKSANAIGLTISPAFLLRADEVIE